MRRILRRISALLVMTGIVLTLAPANFVFAQGLKGQACDAAGTALVTNCDSGDAAAQDKASSVGRTIVDILSLIVGFVSVIMIIIGGLRYILSAGDSSGLQGAKNTIIYALVGLVVVLFAQVIVRFVITKIG